MNDARLRAIALLGGAWLCAGFAWPNAGGMAGAAGGLWVLACVGAVLLAWRRGAGIRVPSTRNAGLARQLVWACLLAMLLGSAAQLLLALPRVAWCLLGFGALWLWPGVGARRRAVAMAAPVLLVLTTLSLAWAGDQHAASAPSSYASLRSGLVLGANPRQSFALVYAPGRTVQVVLDDFVDPREPGVDLATLPPEAQPKGDSVPDYAARLQTNLRAAATVLEPLDLPGTAAAHAALAGMRVELVPAATLAPQEAGGEAPGDEPAGEAGPAVKRGHGLRIRSGARGNGQALRVACPGRLLGRRPVDPLRGCPRKYAAQANAGLGLSARWPGYSEHAGQARVGFEAVARRMGVHRMWRPGLGVVLWALVWIAALLAAARSSRAEGAQSDRGARFFHASLGALALGALTLALCSALEFAPSSWLTLVGGDAGPSNGPLRWDADAWRWPLGIVVASSLWSAKATREGAQQSGAVVARVWVGAMLIVGIATSAWLSHGAGLGEQSVAVRGALLSWIEIAADAVARHGGLPVELARALLASAGLLVIAAAALALHPWGEPARGQDEPSAVHRALWLAGLLGLSWLCARKPAWFDALLACAWLGYEIQRRRGARPKPATRASGQDPAGSPDSEQSPEKAS